MAARDVLKNFNVFVDGRGLIGQTEEYSPPDLTLQTETFRGGGQDAPSSIDMGMEEMETSFTLIAYDEKVLALFGVGNGAQVPLKIRGALQSNDNTVRPVEHTMTGLITQISRGSWTPGQKTSLQITMKLRYYQETVAGQVITEIDIDNMKRIIAGTDHLAEIRTAIGM